MFRAIIVFAFLSLLATGCARSSAVVPESDASDAAAFDAAAVDALTNDVPVILDASADAPDATDVEAGNAELARALYCDLDDEAALDAITNYVGCSWSEYYVSTAALFGWWEAGLLGARNEQTLFGLPYGCSDWHCMAAADSCAEVYACTGSADECEAGTRFCDGDVLTRCARGRVQPVLDCSELGEGFRCEEERGACQRGDCSIGEGWGLALRCDGDALIACEGEDAVRFPCAGQSSGSECAQVYPSGEAPVAYCGVNDGMRRAIYSMAPVRCEENVAVFESLHHGTIRIDCALREQSCMVNMGCT